MLDLYLARHGATDDNHARRYLGRRDLPLSAIGQMQAERLAASLRSTQLQRIVSSPLLRARQTAAVIAQGRSVQVEADSRWLELDFGQWDGLTFDEVRDRFPDEQQRWLASPELIAPGHGETLAALRKRVLTAYHSLVSDHPHGSLMIVTHGGAIRVLLSELTGRSVWDLETICGECYHLGVESGRLLCLRQLKDDDQNHKAK